MSPTRFFIVDVFTHQAFAGNPAGVVLTDAELPFETRTSIAKELAQPATAFVSHPSQLADGIATSENAKISWFACTGSPIAFCGHATVAASVVLLERLFPEARSFTYDYSKVTASGSVTATLKVIKGPDGRVQVAAVAANKPVDVLDIERSTALSQLQATFAVEGSQIIHLQKSLSKDLKSYDLLVVFSPMVDIAALQPDFGTMKRLPYHGIWVTNRPSHAAAARTEATAFEDRVFFPTFGINEDWVCGVAHTLFGPYWASTTPEVAKMTETEDGPSYHVEAHQVSPRGGKLGIIWDGKWGEEGGTASLLGSGRVFASGELYL